MIRVECPGCGKGIKAPEKYAGKQVKCPGCEATLSIPAAAPPPPPAPKPAPAPVVVEQPTPQAAPPPAAPTIAVEHKVKNSSFMAGFGGMMGCLVAIGVVGVLTVGGCIAMVVIGGAAVNEVAKGAGEVLEEARQLAEADKQAREVLLRPHLERIVVVAAQVSPPDEFSFGNTVSIKVRNDNSHVVATVEFDGILKSPNRTLPWAEGAIRYQIDGGLEPGETQEWQLRPGITSEFANCEAPADAELTLVVADAEWPTRDQDLGIVESD